MIKQLRYAALAALALTAMHGTPARAQWGYPGGYGGYGWGGWGGGGETVQGSIARGLGAYAAGAGYYNLQTAQAASINTDTVMRWNQYLYESQVTANRNERIRNEQRRAGIVQAHEQIFNRLRNNPDQRDINSGSALNVALEEINDPRIYSKTLEAAKVRLGGQTIRDIPFNYASAAITTSIHQISQDGPPQALVNDPRFEAEVAALRVLGKEIREKINSGEEPDQKVVAQAIEGVNKLEAKVDATLPRNSRERVQADRYLKSVHGLLAMMQTPALELLLAGVEKRPDATLGELLQFMNAFNLRFGVANTPRQREVYSMLYPKLVSLRDQIAPALASAAPTKAQGTEAGEFFQGMDYKDLQKKAPATPAPPAATPPANPGN